MRTRTILLVSCLFACVALGAANADWGECTDCANIILTTPPGRYSYKINYDTFENLGYPNVGAVTFAAASAADAWNSESGATSFKFTGETTKWWDGENALSCLLNDREYSTIMAAGGLGAKGRMYGDCCIIPYTIDCSQFLIRVDPDSINQVGNLWRGLAQVITHEMGHAADLGHPKHGECSQMNYKCCNSFAHLRQWETRCVEVNESSRDLTAYAKLQLSNGFFYPWNYLLVDNDFDIVHASVDYDGLWNLVYMTGVWPLIWLPDWGEEGLLVQGWNDNPYMSIGPSIVRWREYDPENDYIVVSNYRDAFGMSSRCFAHEAYVFRSNDDFHFDHNQQHLKHCIEMDESDGSYNQCLNGETLDVRPIRRVSTTYYPAWFSTPETTIFVWISGHIPEDGDNCLMWNDVETVRLSLGRIDQYTLPAPLELDQAPPIDPPRSQVSPGVACELFAGPDYYSCMMAYVPPGEDDTEENNRGNIEILAFTPQSGANYQKVAINPNTPVRLSLRTCSDIALWYTADKWWMAIQSMEPGQNTYIYSSPKYDGINWTYSTTLGFTTGGPSVAVDDDGNARIVFVR